mmetsp:Transcript_2661/g.5758  ORF Transcript_2661/g.5758 Transcript_2661/m.5758 type:complete len:295 (+) Transcript_2661:59-943(+)
MVGLQISSIPLLGLFLIKSHDIYSVDGFTTPLQATSRSITTALTSSSITRHAKEKNTDGLAGEDLLSDFCQGTNEFWKNLVIEAVRNYVEISPAESTVNANSTPFQKLTAPPEVPGIPRPVWLTILGSVPTALGWYGYYKFSVEEELYHHEMRERGKVSGCGGYGTLFPFVYGVLIGFPLTLLHIPGGEFFIEAASAWILLGQINLYNRVNQLCTETESIKKELGLTEGPLWEWWALLPPPLDVVVGLRQVHFLSEYWRVVRGYPKEKDLVADELFPFISMPERFTLKQFFSAT